LVCLLIAAVATWRFNDTGPVPLTRADVNRIAQQRLDQAQQEQANAPPDAAVAYQQIGPSLVTITTEGGSAGSQQESSLGAGVVVNADGAVLTALHVVQGSEAIQVRFADGTEAAARVLQSDPANDIAVLSVDRLPEVIVPAVLGGGAGIGDPVFAVGNPLGLQASLTAGVVSATGRSVRAPDDRTLKDLIQFDAAVNPGNSGGPLLNKAGQVVGIVTGLANPARQAYFVGIGFAVPIGTAAGAAGGPLQ
jgi:S1-C subfamily serine protease